MGSQSKELFRSESTLLVDISSLLVAVTFTSLEQ